jgi:predicted HAD superfamily Cof-like phosphohydrolase
MMRSNFDDVGDFHQVFDLDNATHHPPRPHVLDADLMAFRVKFLYEELRELEDAYAEADIAGMFDALIDLAYVTFGLAHLMGLPWQLGWNEVQRANMMKERAASDGSNSKRGSAYDVIKPPGWTPPNIRAILESFSIQQFLKCPQCQRDLASEVLKEVVVQTPFPRVDIHCVCGRHLYSRAV